MMKPPEMGVYLCPSKGLYDVICDIGFIQFFGTNGHDPR